MAVVVAVAVAVVAAVAVAVARAVAVAVGGCGGRCVLPGCYIFFLHGILCL